MKGGGGNLIEGKTSTEGQLGCLVNDGIWLRKDTSNRLEVNMGYNDTVVVFF